MLSFVEYKVFKRDQTFLAIYQTFVNLGGGCIYFFHKYTTLHIKNEQDMQRNVHLYLLVFNLGRSSLQFSHQSFQSIQVCSSTQPLIFHRKQEVLRSFLPRLWQADLPHLSPQLFTLSIFSALSVFSRQFL